MKKVLSILMVAAMAFVMASCDKKDNSGNSGSGNENADGTMLSNLRFHWQKNNADGTWEGTLTFGAGKTVQYHVTWNWPEYEIPVADITLQGTYTCNETTENGIHWGRGHMSFTGDGVITTWETDYACDGTNLSLENPPQRDYFALERVRD